MAPMSDCSSAASAGGIPVTTPSLSVNFQVPPELLASSKHPEKWPVLILTTRSNATVRSVLKRLKKVIAKRLGAREDLMHDDLPGLMDEITRARKRQHISQPNLQDNTDGHQESDTLSDEEKNTCWMIRFDTKMIVTKKLPSSDQITKKFLPLDTDIGKRILTLHDLSPNPGNMKDSKPRIVLDVDIRVVEWGRITLEASTKPLTELIFPTRTKDHYVQVGNVQSKNASSLGLLPTASTISRAQPQAKKQTIPASIDRRNAIVAVFPEIQNYQVQSRYRLVPCWEFEPRFKNPAFRIGDRSQGREATRATIRNIGDTKLWKACERMKANEYMDEIYAQSKKPKPSRRAPLLPALTFNKYDPSENGNASAAVTTNAACYAAINVFHTNHDRVTDRYYPSSTYVRLHKDDKVSHVESKLFEANKAQDQIEGRPNQGLQHATIDSWWIMPEGVGPAKMHKIGKDKNPFQYVRDAQSRSDKVQLYMECHMGPIIQDTPTVTTNEARDYLADAEEQELNDGDSDWQPDDDDQGGNDEEDDGYDVDEEEDQEDQDAD